MKIFKLLFITLFFTSCISKEPVTEKYELTYMDGTKEIVTITHGRDFRINMVIGEGMKYLIVTGPPGTTFVNGVSRREIPGVDYFKLVK